VLYPQRLINVYVPKGFDFRSDVTIKSSVQQAESDLGSDGRILLRASGTEPLIRVMVEGKMKQKVDYWAEQIAGVVQQATNGSFQ
jgi:phosphoglucosamine mutase